MRSGSVWKYRGTVTTRVNPNSIPAEFRTTPVELEMRGVQLVRRGGTTGALVRGFPYDLYEPGKEPEIYAIVDAGGKVFVVNPQRAQTVFERLNNQDDGLHGLLNESDIFLGTPLAVGQKFCESEQITRPDNMYCWIVIGQRQFTGGSVKGVPAMTGVEFEITKSANSGSNEFRILPGVGITWFAFSSRCASCGDGAEISLVEYRSNVH